MNKFLLLGPAVLLAAGLTYTFALAPPPAEEPPMRIEGEVYVLPREFTVTLAGSRYAKVGVGLVLAHGYTSTPASPAEGAPAELPEGFGPLEQEAAVRAIVTEVLTGSQADRLESKRGRRAIKERIRRLILRTTDVEVDEVLLTDITVQ